MISNNAVHSYAHAKKELRTEALQPPEQVDVIAGQGIVAKVDGHKVCLCVRERGSSERAHVVNFVHVHACGSSFSPLLGSACLTLSLLTHFGWGPMLGAGDCSQVVVGHRRCLASSGEEVPESIKKFIGQNEVCAITQQRGTSG